MNEADAMTPRVSAALSSEVTELDNPVLEKATAENAPMVTPLAEAAEAPTSGENINPVEDIDLPTDEWETVSFPDAVIPIETLPESESIDIVTSLEQQNQTLRDRVSYLETTLATAQTNLCQEVARWESLALAGDERLQEQAQTQEQTIAKYVEELTDTQKKVTHLFAQLELSHQTAQRQQVVMETINTQLRNSQERVAQLERECAGVHQQNIDQSQQVLQQEHQIRDLQARLQRQQRYTLQYKAALEKSLEVPAVTSATPALLSETTPHQLGAKQVNMPKPSPVQPWSAPTTEAEESNANSEKAWLNSFMSDSETLPTEDVVTNFDWQPSEETPDAPVSFNLDELPDDAAIELDIAQFNAEGNRLDAWENSTASPFITLQINHDDGVNSEPKALETASPKLESIGAVDLPMFQPKPEEQVEIMSHATTEVAQEAQK
ncbi:hypothetical protein IQ266_20730 [filamentous cyanobacterium LEGE 11480]|uniref:Uncharacterized protein n=1 Tax=Romeriopsis navalis LEGE 11480 TaxID=2777977 RepID=A0A928VQY7_9CYAN|nr:hypothetical protein [Romeriopsis navalis]MBE9032168.1 hypothetical protein [Romeriopsis navalis LEGE 11480]